METRKRLTFGKLKHAGEREETPPRIGKCMEEHGGIGDQHVVVIDW